MKQTWLDLCFAHWPVPVDELRRRIPSGLGTSGLDASGLEIDTFDGQAWIGIVPFTMTGIRFHWLPPLPGLSAFHELNVRTYVTRGGKPGVWFFSLDAASKLSVLGARKLYHLPYYFARMSLKKEAESVRYTSARRDCHGPFAQFRARYGPAGEAIESGRGSLEEWLTERYCLYAAARDGRLFCGEIDHAPWKLQPAWLGLETCSIAAASGIQLPDSKPLLHFSARQEAVVWGLERVR